MVKNHLESGWVRGDRASERAALCCLKNCVLMSVGMECVLLVDNKTAALHLRLTGAAAAADSIERRTGWASGVFGAAPSA